jgi:hypothetical protein
MRNAYKIFVGKPEGRRPLARPRRRWEYNIDTYLREIGFGVMDRIQLARNTCQWRAVANTAMKLRLT